MSLYEKYNTVSVDYDKTRVPVGCEIIAECLTTSGKPLAEMRLLDAGCGTGNYAQKLIQQVNRIDAIDLNRAMIVAAREKLRQEEREQRIAFSHGSIADMPFHDERFDAVMINTVLHHMETGEDLTYPAHRHVIAEVFRVLKPEGVIVLSVVSREQIRDGFWFCELIPEAMGAVCNRFITMDTLESMLVEIGFQYKGRIVPLDAVIQGEAYFDPHGPLKPEWRNAVSFWALVSPKELAGVANLISILERKGKLQAFFEKRDGPRRRVGQITFCYALKPASA